MFLHVQLDGRPDQAGERARELAATGIDGLFTFEGQYDVFLPLAAAAATTDAELMTNVAIALPRSPLHLAHAAYDLQLLSGGRFRLGLGLADPAAHRKPVWQHLEPSGRAHARDRAGCASDPRGLAAQPAAGVPRRVHQAHADDAGVQPGPQPVRRPADLPRGAGPVNDQSRRRGGRRASRHAVSLCAPLP